MPQSQLTSCLTLSSNLLGYWNWHMIQCCRSFFGPVPPLLLIVIELCLTLQDICNNVNTYYFKYFNNSLHIFNNSKVFFENSHTY